DRFGIGASPNLAEYSDRACRHIEVRMKNPVCLNGKARVLCRATVPIEDIACNEALVAEDFHLYTAVSRNPEHVPHAERAALQERGPRHPARVPVQRCLLSCVFGDRGLGIPSAFQRGAALPKHLAVPRIKALPITSRTSALIVDGPA